MRAAVLLVVMLALVTGCGPMPESPPPTSPPTLPAATTAPATPAATPGTPAVAQLTLGELAQRVNTAWAGLSSYRVTFTGPAAVPPAMAATPIATPLATPVASPVASPGATPVASGRAGQLASVREVILPDRQRQEVHGLGGYDHEAVATSDRIYIRGPLTDQIAPGTPPDTWLEVDPSRLPPDSVLTRVLGGLPQVLPSPLAQIPDRLLTQPVRDLGSVEFDGRICQVYGAANTVPTTGTRIDYAIAIDDRNLPCYIETTAAGQLQGRDEYTDLDAPLTIPVPAATPVGVPAALATPVTGD